MQAIEARWQAFGPRIDPVIKLKLGPLSIVFDNFMAIRRERKNPKLRTSAYYCSDDPLAFRLELLTGRRIDAAQFLNGSSECATDGMGYRWIFADPPYPLKMTQRRVEKLFGRMNELLFGRLDDRSEIYSWSTDWCSYFDQGRVCSGAFLWTVRNANAPIAWVGASASD